LSQSFRSSLGQRSITYKGAILWNAVPEELKGIVSTTKFNLGISNPMVKIYYFGINS